MGVGVEVKTEGWGWSWGYCKAEVQGCSPDCDYPCLSECGRTWDECYVEREYAGTYDLRMAADNEVILGVLRRHVRRKGEDQQRKRARKPREFTS